MIYCRWWSGCIMTSWCSGSMPRSTTNVMIRCRCRLKRGKRVKPRRWLTCSTSKDRKRAWCGPDRRKVCRASTGPTVHRWRSCSASWSSYQWRGFVMDARLRCPRQRGATMNMDGAEPGLPAKVYPTRTGAGRGRPLQRHQYTRTALPDKGVTGATLEGLDIGARPFQTAGRVPVQSARPSHSRTALPGA